MSAKPLINKRDMASLLSISVGTLNRRMAAREIPYIKQSVRCIRFDADKVLATVGRREVKAFGDKK